MNLVINNQLVGLTELRKAWRSPLTVELGTQAQQRVAESNEMITDVLASGDQVYGVNTGFGQLAQVRISDDDLAQLQENLVRSHSVGVGKKSRRQHRAARDADENHCAGRRVFGRKVGTDRCTVRAG